MQGRPARFAQPCGLHARTLLGFKMTLLRGKGTGIEVVLSGQPFDEALAELAERLAERPGFYRGSEATAVFDVSDPDPEHVARLGLLLDQHGLALRGLAIAGPVADALEARRERRARRAVQLSDSARSLVADFAGARSDIAQRRQRGETSVPRVDLRRPSEATTEAPALRVVDSGPQTLYHQGTLRGGQSLHQVGSIVIVGDVNPGAELVASGDIIVFGRLAGTAHAGAQGDVKARIYALDLRPTQLRIATSIAADAVQRASEGPEVAAVRENRIIIVSFSQLHTLEEEAVR